MASRSGILDSVVIEPSIEKNIIDSMMWWTHGDKVENHLITKFGIVFLKFDSQDELLSQSKEMQRLICANIKST